MCITGVLTCAAHTQRIATPCLSYKLFVVNVNKQCMIHKTYNSTNSVLYYKQSEMMVAYGHSRQILTSRLTLKRP